MQYDAKEDSILYQYVFFLCTHPKSAQIELQQCENTNWFLYYVFVGLNG